MGLRGPAPKPTAIKKAAGNPGRRRLNENEPIPPRGDVLPPPWLSDQALEVWHRAAPVALAMRVLTLADVIPFARYCDYQARYLELREFFRGKGATGTLWVVKDGEGDKAKIRHMAENPLSIELRKLGELLLRLEQQFGFTPAARARIRVEDVRPAAVDAEPVKGKGRGAGPYSLAQFLADTADPEAPSAG